MGEALINHLWQSTLFGLAAGALALACRQNQAKVRFYIWLAASAKFLIPFELIVWIGMQLRFGITPPFAGDPELTIVLDQIARPAAPLAAHLYAIPMATSWGNTGGESWRVLLAIWLAGTALLIGRRVYQWLYLRVVTELSSPLDIAAPIPVRETNTTLEPGLFGIFSPTLLLPNGLTTQLTPTQLDAILEHELCHWRRRDNLAAAVHMLVEALFWFHPMVWWLGGQLVAERERACDEAVVRSGWDRHAYAEGILEICRRYVKASLCSAGISGGSLKRRMEEIMTDTTIDKLSIAKKCALAVAACATFAVPLAVGLGSSASVALAGETGDAPMKHYKNDEWQFELDVPERWVPMPPVSSNSPLEVIRFGSQENGTQTLIVFRSPVDPNQSIERIVDGTQATLARIGFANFVQGETSIGSRRIKTLDFSRTTPDGQPWYCHYYYFVDGTVRYVLAFGTTSDPNQMLGLYDRMANTFQFQAS
jgi:beta-lactamase regulating signal transducer with metallopeptidase domain